MFKRVKNTSQNSKKTYTKLNCNEREIEKEYMDKISFAEKKLGPY